MSDTPEVFVLVHVPKTGGTSLNHAFEHGLEMGTEFIHLDTAGLRHGQSLGLPPFAERSEAERRKARVIAGHDIDVTIHRLVPGRTPRYFTFLRNPAARLVSAYNFEMHEFYSNVGKTPIEFDDWYRKQERDVVTRFLSKRVLPTPLGRRLAQAQRYLQYPLRGRATRGALARLNRALERFWYVGTTDAMNQAAPLLLERMGIEARMERRLVTGRDFTKRLELDAALEARLHADNPRDLELYEHWRTRDAESLERAVAR
ncbi:MAG: sulfotransferase family 2 domain-containing protein [Gemmatimonadota bacterium]